MLLNENNRKWFEQVREEWALRLKPFSTSSGGHVFHVASRVPQEALTSAKIFSNRYHALSSLDAGGIMAEVGTQTGDFAKFILKSLRPKELICFDIYDDDIKDCNPSIFGEDGFSLIIGDSSTELAKFDDEYFDIIYIDGDHSLEGASKDAAVASQKLKGGGVMVFNDYTMWSVRELTDYGVVPVVNSMLSNGGWRVEYLALEELMYCDIALRKL